MTRSVFLLIACTLIVHAQNDSKTAAAEKARDQADIPKLQELIENARHAAAERSTAGAQQWLALLNFYLTEAIYVQGKNELVRGAAEEGLAAAEKASALDPASSEAHRLQADMAVMLIPNSTKDTNYAKRAVTEAEKALELDPKNAKAWVSRGLMYFYAPVGYGGDQEKALQVMKKAVELEPSFDVPHIFLAQMYLATNKKDEAVREINEALRLNPNRRSTQMTYKTLMAAGDSKK
jgi:tetratricopeptide (TPR) repeat protein